MCFPLEKEEFHCYLSVHVCLKPIAPAAQCPPFRRGLLNTLNATPKFNTEPEHDTGSSNMIALFWRGGNLQVSSCGCILILFFFGGRGNKNSANSATFYGFYGILEPWQTNHLHYSPTCLKGPIFAQFQLHNSQFQRVQNECYWVLKRHLRPEKRLTNI